MKKMLKRLCTGFLALATVVTALPTTPVHAESKQYWTESAERVGIIEKVMNDSSIGSTFNEGYMKVASTGILPQIIFNMEVFPEPLLPTTETNSPLSIVRLKS